MKVFGQHDEKTMEQARDVASRAKRFALMADGHMGYIMPIGGVAAYDNMVSIAGVGYDIACGNAAIRTNLTLEEYAGLSLDEIERNPHRVIGNRKLNELADELWSHLSFGIGRKNNADDAPVDHELFHDPAWWAIPNTGGYRDTLMEKARKQLGTIGSGNHYADVFVDENGYLWVGVHFGSRGFGHTVASAFLALSAGKEWGARVAEHEGLVNLSDPIGHDYWHLMELAGRYAYAGREWVARTMVRIMGGEEVELVHNHHNFAWKEFHAVPGDGEELQEMVVVRKGATPAWPGQKGFVGGSMGDNAVILQGVEARTQAMLDPEAEAVYRTQEEALFSTVHGAGRVMSRTEARGKIHRKTGRVIKPGKITPEMMKGWLAEKGVILRGGGLDEAPQAYRRLPEVLAAQGPTIEVLHTLRPLVVCMAGENEFDPYKD